jgi:hypothetical protein
MDIKKSDSREPSPPLPKLLTEASPFLLVTLAAAAFREWALASQEPHVIHAARVLDAVGLAILQHRLVVELVVNGDSEKAKSAAAKAAAAEAAAAKVAAAEAAAAEAAAAKVAAAEAALVEDVRKADELLSKLDGIAYPYTTAKDRKFSLPMRDRGYLPNLPVRHVDAARKLVESARFWVQVHFDGKLATWFPPGRKSKPVLARTDGLMIAQMMLELVAENFPDVLPPSTFTVEREKRLRKLVTAVEELQSRAKADDPSEVGSTAAEEQALSLAKALALETLVAAGTKRKQATNWIAASQRKNS